jgi:hypothetical protein
MQQSGLAKTMPRRHDGHMSITSQQFNFAFQDQVHGVVLLPTLEKHFSRGEGSGSTSTQQDTTLLVVQILEQARLFRRAEQLRKATFTSKTIHRRIGHLAHRPLVAPVPLSSKHVLKMEA